MAEIVGAICSGEKTADAAIYSAPCLLAAVLVITNGTDDAKLIIYDNTSAAGKVVLEITVTGSDNYGGVIYNFPKIMNIGIYCDVSGTGASYIIDYVVGNN